MTEGPVITAIAPWFGGNRILAHAVGEELLGSRWVGVPFAGGMPELLYVDAPTIVVGDLHKHVINLAICTACPVRLPVMLKELRRLPFHPDTLAAAQTCCTARERQRTPKSVWMAGDTRWAVDYFVCVWMGRSSIAGTESEFNGNLPVRWNANGGDSNMRYRSAVKSLAAWHRVVRRCNFVVEDCFALLKKVKDRPAHGLYCDPPFPGTGDKYRHKFTEAQHRELADTLGNFRHARIVCRFYDHALIRELYPEGTWTWRRMKGRKQSNAAAPEVLVINGPSYAEDNGQRLFD